MNRVFIPWRLVEYLSSIGDTASSIARKVGMTRQGFVRRCAIEKPSLRDVIRDNGKRRHGGARR